MYWVDEESEPVWTVLPPTVVVVQVGIWDFIAVCRVESSVVWSTPFTRKANTPEVDVVLTSKAYAAETSLSDLPRLLSHVVSSGFEVDWLTKSLPFIENLVSVWPPSVSGRSASSSFALLGREIDGSAMTDAAAVGVAATVGVGLGVGVALLVVELEQATSTTLSRQARAAARTRFMVVGRLTGGNRSTAVPPGDGSGSIRDAPAAGKRGPIRGR